MKKTLAIALAFASVAGTALAQQTVEPRALPLIERSTIGEPAPISAGVAAEHDFVWYSRILVRGVPDTNRRDLTVPLDLGTVEMRGFGQIFPAPASLYQIYNGSIYNGNGSVVFDNLDTSFATDQDYIDQFKDVTTYTINAFRFPYFKNPYAGPTQNPGLIEVYKTSFNFRGSGYKTQGFSIGRHQSTLTKMREIELGTDAVDTTIQVGQTGDTLINPTLFIFDGDPGSGNEPLTFGANESAIVLYTNEFAPVVTQPVAAYDTREYQRVLATEEYRTGDVEPDPDNPGSFLDTRANPLDSTKCFGVVMFRANGTTKDSIYSAWTGLVFGSGAAQRRAIVNLGISFFGTVTFSGGVNYHFGKDIADQGIGSSTPNPVHDHATIPFSLRRVNDIRIDLYDASGALVKNVVDHRYIPGNYSVDFTTEGLPNGVYLARMIAGDNVYTSKLTISR